MKKITLFLFALFAAISINTNAQWSLSPLVNTVVDSAGSPNAFVSVSDGLGGVIIAWEDYRPGSSDIYVQRINYAGVVLWEDTGVVICTAIFSQFTLAIVSDGLGGAIITWEDQRDGTGPPDVYAQRVNADGAVQWTSDGVAICTAANGQYDPIIASDGSGGAIIAWQDSRVGGSRVYINRINNTGIVQWGTDGVPVTSSVSYQIDHSMVSDGSGGAVIVWADLRNGNYDIYAQKVNASGAMQWSVDGVAICTQVIQQRFTTLVSDGSGGAIVSWNDDRGDLYAQRINGSGTVKWATDGITVSAANNAQINPKLVSADSASVIITWEDLRTNTAYHIYAQRIDTSGNVRWTADGVAICTATNSQSEPFIVSDSSGGAIITWKDARSNTGDMDLYAQRINASGTVQWTSNGVAISTIDPDYLDTPKASIVPDGAGGAIITWLNIRNVNDWLYDIYAQNICTNGVIGIAPPPPPTNVTTSANLTICSGLGTSLSASGTGRLGWYTASKGGTYLSGEANLTTQALTTTTTFYVQDSTCTANTHRTAIKVTVNSLPTIIVTPNLSLCIGQSIALSPIGASNFVWSPASGLSSTTGSTIAAPPVGVTSYTVTGTDVNGCSDDALVEIAMYQPQLLVSPDMTVCSGKLATLSSAGFDTYAWFPSTGLNTSTGNSVQANLSAGIATYTVTGTFTLVAGCANNASVKVSVNSPDATITPNTIAICSGDSVRISSTVTAETYLWNTGASGTSIVVKPATSKTYSLTVSIGNCFDTASVFVTVTALPTATISGETSICSGKRILLSENSSIPNLSYLWSTGSTGQSINAIPLITTTYSVVVSNGDVMIGCKDTAFIEVGVTTSPTITLTANKTIVCGGESVNISASGGGTGTGIYLWSTGASINAINMTPLSSQNVILTLSNGNCFDKDSIRITVVPLPTAGISGSSTVCSGNSAQLTATGGSTYLWNTAETTASITKTPLSNTSYSVTVSNGSASGGGLCIDTASRSITLINPIPTDVGPDITMAIGLDTVLSTNNGTEWNWSPLGRLNCYTCQSTVASPLQTTNYIVTVTDINGCIANDSITIFIIPCATLFIPKAFSPNNDGQNDVLYIRGTDCIDKVFSFTIFNRWGEKVFETTDIKAGWDGSQTMQTLPNEVFIYYLDALSISGDTISKTGNITLMK